MFEKVAVNTMCMDGLWPAMMNKSNMFEVGLMMAVCR